MYRIITGGLIMENFRNLLQILDILMKWLFNMEKYYYITATIILISRLMLNGGAVGFNNSFDGILIMLILFKITSVMKSKVIK